MSNPDQKKSIIIAALAAGCCKRCALRFTASSGIIIDFENPDEYLNQIGLNSINSEMLQDLNIKKIKGNPCVVCLNILSDELLFNFSTHEFLKDLRQYDCQTFVNYISFPPSLLIREHSKEIYLKEKFPNFKDECFTIALNKVWTFSIQNKIADFIGKKYDKNSGFSIQFNVAYKYENDEIKVLNKMEKIKCLNRNMMAISLKTIEDTLFKENVFVPPKVTTNSIILEKIVYSHEPIYVVGRYCKYSRHLGQTPWVLDNVKVFETSVQEIIFDALKKIFICKEMTFSASGREDYDVRTLGKGRPFYVKIFDSKITNATYEQFRCIENEIKQSNLISVRDLQFTNKKSLSIIKDGEETKRKCYKALCIIDEPSRLNEYIENINNLYEITIEQKTPIRVLHRRTVSTRKRQITNIKASTIEGKNNLFELYLITQAGTYVKEFVHGDLGRTIPSLGDIIKGFVDIILLDVLEIFLDFPPSVN